MPLGREAIFGTSHVSQPIFARKRCFTSRTTGLCEGFRKKTRCGEMATKTAILGGFRRVGEIWVAAEEHFGSVKRSLRAGLAWKKRGNGSVASACAAKTGSSRFGDHSGALPPAAGTTWPKSMFLTPAVAGHYKTQNTYRKQPGKISDPRPAPKLATFASAAAHNSPFLRALRLAPQRKHQKPTTKIARAQRDSNPNPIIRNRQHVHIVVPRPLPRPLPCWF